MAEPFTSDDPAQRLRDAWAELRTLPLGGRGYLADACLDGAAEIERLRGVAESAYAAVHAACRALDDRSLGDMAARNRANAALRVITAGVRHV